MHEQIIAAVRDRIAPPITEPVGPVAIDWIAREALAALDAAGYVLLQHVSCRWLGEKGKVPAL